MDLDEIEQLVKIIRDAKISELTVSAGGAKVRLRKLLPPPVSVPPAPPKAEASAVEAEPVSVEEPATSGTYITAPMVGIFHSVDSASAVGTVVEVGQVVGAIESMKLMNDVMAEHDGVIAEILVEDGVPVEYGQNLFRLEGE